MKKSHLTRKLSEIEDFKDPRVELEQYQTPPQLAADIAYNAYMQGNEKVIDLGTGNGIIAIGAALLGLKVTAVEIDRKALERAKENSEEFGVEIDFVEKDVTDFKSEEGFDAVLMNPPFNIQSDEGVKFWEKALEIGDSVYGLAGKGFEARLKRLCNEFNHEILASEAYTIGLPASYRFHTESVKETPVDLYITEANQ
ncbi:MAG: METTL5 family protein [Candidatus Nanohaloarchaea archaeon]